MLRKLITNYREDKLTTGQTLFLAGVMFAVIMLAIYISNPSVIHQ